MIFYAMVGFFLGDHLASWNPDESYSNEDKHKAPTPCPYRTGEASFPSLIVHLIRTGADGSRN